MRRLLACLMLGLAACGGPTPPPPAAAPNAPPAVADWALPVEAAAQPDLVALADGTLLLSWIEKGPQGHALRLARHTGAGWDASRTVAQGRDWFVNWADTPHVQATPDGALWAHWLRKSADATYAYDVVLSRSGDGGATWAAPVVVHDDDTPTEHGFVSMWPAAHDALGIAWLDGRATGGGHHGAHGAGMMTLRSARFDAALGRSGEGEIDASTCDCCPTAAALTARGPVLVYRDRTDAEIRDIAATRYAQGAWTTPRLVHADGWTMPACPVNGPAVAARGEQVMVGWYTGAGSAPSVRVARSGDAGDTFGPALRIDHGAEVLGRVALAFAHDRPWVLWQREDAQGQSIQLARLTPDASAVEHRLELARLAGRGRGTGMPRLVASRGRLHVVWTDLVDGAPRLRGAVLALD